MTKPLYRAADRKPYLKFFPQAWFGDTALRGCSAAARGLWTDLLMVMHQDGEPYGYLSRGDAPIPDDELAKLCGVSLSHYRRLVAELEARTVFSRDVQGRIYSRKMVRDGQRAREQADHGHESLRNPRRPSHKRHTLQGGLVGSPTRVTSVPPSSTNTTKRKEDLEHRPDPTPADLAARDELRAAWGRV